MPLFLRGTLVKIQGIDTDFAGRLIWEACKKYYREVWLEIESWLSQETVIFLTLGVNLFLTLAIIRRNYNFELMFRTKI